MERDKGIHSIQEIKKGLVASVQLFPPVPVPKEIRLTESACSQTHKAYSEKALMQKPCEVEPETEG